MEAPDAYAASRAQLIEQAATLGPEQHALPVPALPGWTVHDAYAHLAGVCADVLEGRMEGGGSPEWTARQVRERKDRSLGELCEEWAGNAAPFGEWFEGAGPRGMFVVYDVWTHQQDVRGALDLAGVRDERMNFLLEQALGVFDQRLREADVAPVRIHGESVDRVIGGSDAAVELRAGDYEVMRLIFGRRSRRQIDQMYWHGDYASVIDHLHLFDLPEVDLID